METIPGIRFFRRLALGKAVPLRRAPLPSRLCLVRAQKSPFRVFPGPFPGLSRAFASPREMRRRLGGRFAPPPLRVGSVASLFGFRSEQTWFRTDAETTRERRVRGRARHGAMPRRNNNNNNNNNIDNNNKEAVCWAGLLILYLSLLLLQPMLLLLL